MKTKTSKAQLEVWEWKEQLQEQLKDVPKGEQIRFIQSQTAQTIQELLAKRQKQTKFGSVNFQLITVRLY